MHVTVTAAEHPGLILLRQARTREGSIAKAAKAAGLPRSTASMILSGTYPADPSNQLDRVVARLGRIACPARDGAGISLADCAAYRARPMPTSSPAAVKMWRACQCCDQRQGETDAANRAS